MNLLRSCSRIITRVQNVNSVNLIDKRYIGRHIRAVMHGISKRKNEAGQKDPDQRSSYSEWNYEAEIYAFNQRLKEKFSLDLLGKALTHKSYLFQEEKKQRDVGIENPVFDFEDNKGLIETGRNLTSKIIEVYLGSALPRTPEECILAIHDYLMSHEILAKTSSLIGTKDIILAEEYPPTEETMANTFLALVAALAESVDETHAGLFVRDFLIASLAEKDISEIWNPEYPVEILNDILIRSGKGPVEPRIIAQSGITSLVPVYQIGLYSNREYISSGTEDNINDAIRAAALKALCNMFDIAECSAPIKFNLSINPLSDTMKNLPLHKWCIDNVHRLL